MPESYVESAFRRFVNVGEHVDARPTGTVSTLGGSGAIGFVDGVGAAARFYNPRGVAVDAADNVYVVDQSNHRIRTIS